MKKLLYLPTLLCLITLSIASTSKTEPLAVEFKAKDGLVISAETYFIESDKPMILLCHQAGYNKAEYAGIAPNLNTHGFSVMAIDQRSGGKLKGLKNETAERAKSKDLKTKYIDAEQDILAAIDYAYEQNGNKPIILWGSSYSAGLALHIAPKNNKVLAVIAFSPGDYFGKAKPNISKGLVGFTKPMFLSSARLESKRVKDLISETKLSKNQTHFIPVGLGRHGSSALWDSAKDHEEYWLALNNFLRQF